MKKRVVLLTFLFSALLVLSIAGNMSFGAAQTSTPFNGIISSDTTWTKANSPYTLTGDIIIFQGATLSIEAGVIVNLGNYSLQVNGALVAKGASTDKIHFNLGSVNYPNYGITLTSSSSGWNEQTGSGCIIENAIISSTICISSSAKIDNNTFIADGTLLVESASPIISGNNIGSIGIDRGSPLIFNNTVSSSIEISSGSPIIINNTITILPTSDGHGHSIYQSSGIFIYGNNSAYISDNTISADVDEEAILVNAGTPTIQRNLITNPIGYNAGLLNSFQAAIDIGIGASPIIQNNTITKNAIGIACSSSSPTIIFNNMQDNAVLNFYLFSGETSNITAVNNWWGTTDILAIGKSILDYKNDFSLGNVNFIPFLTAPNPQASPNASSAALPTSPPSPTQSPTPTPTPTPSPTLSPTPSPSIPEFPSWTILPIITVATLLSTVPIKRKVAKKYSSNAKFSQE